jgi:DNA-binding transcriptional ArsR family regulator
MRMAIVEKLSARPMAVGELAGELPVTRPAVSQHLKVLKKARLVRDEARGTRRIYSIDPAGLGQIRAWLDRHWERALAAFVQEVEKEEEE